MKSSWNSSDREASVPYRCWYHKRLIPTITTVRSRVLVLMGGVPSSLSLSASATRSSSSREQGLFKVFCSTLIWNWTLRLFQFFTAVGVQRNINLASSESLHTLYRLYMSVRCHHYILKFKHNYQEISNSRILCLD